MYSTISGKHGLKNQPVTMLIDLLVRVGMRLRTGCSNCTQADYISFLLHLVVSSVEDEAAINHSSQSDECEKKRWGRGT